MSSAEVLAQPHWSVLAEVQAAALAQAEVANRRYVLSPYCTPGLSYDDRLHVRLGCGKTKAYELLQLGPAKGGIRSQRVGTKYIVTEAAVREFLTTPTLDLPNLTGKVNTIQLAQVETEFMPAEQVRFAPEPELIRVATEVATDIPELADEAHFVVRKELHRRANKKALVLC